MDSLLSFFVQDPAEAAEQNQARLVNALADQQKTRGGGGETHDAMAIIHTAMRQLQDEISELNQQAVDMLLTPGRDLQQAMLILGRATVLLEQLVLLVQVDQSQGQTREESSDSDSSMNDNMFLWNQPGISNLSVGNLFIYNKPILLLNDNNAKHVANSDDLVYMRASLLFNIALTFHSLGTQSGDATQLQNAILIYDMSFQAFRQVVNDLPEIKRLPQKDQMYRIQLFLLAAWNNQAQIHHELGNAAHAVTMLQEQNSLIADLHHRLLNRNTHDNDMECDNSNNPTKINNNTTNQTHGEMMKLVESMLQDVLLNDFVVRSLSMAAPMA